MKTQRRIRLSRSRRSIRRVSRRSIRRRSRKRTKRGGRKKRNSRKRRVSRKKGGFPFRKKKDPELQKIQNEHRRTLTPRFNDAEEIITRFEMMEDPVSAAIDQGDLKVITNLFFKKEEDATPTAAETFADLGTSQKIIAHGLRKRLIKQLEIIKGVDPVYLEREVNKRQALRAENQKQREQEQKQREALWAQQKAEAKETREKQLKQIAELNRRTGQDFREV